MGLSGFPRMGGDPAGTLGHSAHRGATNATEESQDGFAGIGLPAEAGWYVSAALYWISGLAVVLFDQLSSASTINPVIGVLGTLALAGSPLMLLGARFAPDAAWGAPVRILVPSIFFGVGVFVVGDAINALALLFLFPVLAVAYMHKPSISIPYCSISLVVMDAALLAYDSSDAGIARVIILSGVVAALVAGLIFSQHKLRIAAAENHSHSVTDPLTGLANLRGLHARLEQEMQRSARDHSEVVMYGIDLDDFKEVNERFSYALGDAVLQAVANALSEELEPGDLLARRGGDEFAVLAVAAPGRHMARFGDRLAATVERTRRSICPGVNPRASITRVSHRPGESADAFIRRVDDGLHHAKIDAHPERGQEMLLAVNERFNSTTDEQSERVIDGARRAQVGMKKERAKQPDADLALSWLLCAGAAGASAVLLCLAILPGLLPEARNGMSLIAVLGLLAIAIGSFVAARAPIAKPWLHAPVASMVVLFVGVISAAGSADYALAELCVLPVPLAVVTLGWRQAIPYVVFATAAYATFVLGSAMPFATVQTLILIGVTAALTVLLARGERLTSDFSAAAEAISIVDPLTGAANLRGFEQRIDQEIARSDAMGDELCLVMIDLDRFKTVNDRYSHSMGDALLIETTRAIESVVREDEMVVRRGGDEFVVVCAPSVRRDMDTLMLRLRDAIFSARVRLTPDIAAGATVTTVFREFGESSEELTRRADDALREAKSRERRAVSQRI